MWSIEVSSEASEEEINQTLLEQLDFDYIRECVAELRLVVQKYGPFKEIQERTEGVSTDEYTRTYDEKEAGFVTNSNQLIAESFGHWLWISGMDARGSLRGTRRNQVEQRR